jgi:iron-sulfur cluster assembly protein
MAKITAQQHHQHPLRLTTAAAKHIAKKIAATPNAIGFRLSVKNAGCNSKKYVTDYLTKIDDNDVSFVEHDITLVVRKEDLLYIAGTEIDYVQDGINKVLKYNNPNVTTACGCGESFNIA